MLGRYVRVKITRPMNSFDREKNFSYKLNFGTVESGLEPRSPVKGAYIMGLSHRAFYFEGRVIATVKNDSGVYLIVAPKSKRFIVHEIEDAIAFAEKPGTYTLSCLYENSCGAVVFREINGETRYLIIKNKRSLNWGFPKGHMERGENEHETAYREVLEETGLRIRFLPNYRYKSEYSIGGKIEKKVVIFLGTTDDTNTVIQREEIEEYLWLGFEKAMEHLKFPNDKFLLRKADEYLKKM